MLCWCCLYDLWRRTGIPEIKREYDVVVGTFSPLFTLAPLLLSSDEPTTNQPFLLHPFFHYAQLYKLKNWNNRLKVNRWTKIKGRRKKVVLLGGLPPPPSVVVKVPLFVMYSITPDRGGAHKLISFIVFLHVLKASASNGSKNKKWYLFGRKLWSGLEPPTTQKYHFFWRRP